MTPAAKPSGPTTPTGGPSRNGSGAARDRGPLARMPGQRTTRQRAAIIEFLAHCENFRSAQDIFEQLRSRGHHIGLTTIYRTLQSLADAREIDVIRTEAGEAVYRRCSEQHHHHLVCRNCQRTVEIKGPAVERWAARIAEKHGYVDVNHVVEISGLCPDCSTI